MPASIKITIVKWESKWLLNEKIKPPITANNSLSPKLSWMNNSKVTVEFKRSCLKQDKVTFTPRNVVNLSTVYELDAWSKELNIDFTLKDCLFGAIKLSKNADPDKYSYSGYGIEFDPCSLFSLQNFDWVKNTIILGVGNSSPVHINTKKKDVLVLGEGPTQGIDYTAITAEAKYSINFSRSRKFFCLSLHYNGSNVFYFANGTKYINLKQNTLK